MTPLNSEEMSAGANGHMQATVTRRPSKMGDAMFEKDRTALSYEVATGDGRTIIYNPPGDIEPRNTAGGTVQDIETRKKIMDALAAASGNLLASSKRAD